MSVDIERTRIYSERTLPFVVPELGIRESAKEITIDKTDVSWRPLEIEVKQEGEKTVCISLSMDAVNAIIEAFNDQTV